MGFLFKKKKGAAVSTKAQQDTSRGGRGRIDSSSNSNNNNQRSPATSSSAKLLAKAASTPRTAEPTPAFSERYQIRVEENDASTSLSSNSEGVEIIAGGPPPTTVRKTLFVEDELPTSRSMPARSTTFIKAESRQDGSDSSTDEEKSWQANLTRGMSAPVPKRFFPGKSGPIDLDAIVVSDVEEEDEEDDDHEDDQESSGQDGSRIEMANTETFDDSTIPTQSETVFLGESNHPEKNNKQLFLDDCGGLETFRVQDDFSKRLPTSPVRISPIAANRLLDAVTCGQDTTNVVQGNNNSIDENPNMDVLYDFVCADVRRRPSPSAVQQPPYYDEHFAIQFLQVMMQRGISLLYLQPPNANETEEWNGRSVTMIIKPGSGHTPFEMQPKLQWSTFSGGKEKKMKTTSISLLKIHAISQSLGEDIKQDDDDDLDDDDDENKLCFFSVTTNQGDVHVFETASKNQQAFLTRGLKNVIARLSFQLIAGDCKTSSELHSAAPMHPISESAPSHPNPHQNMNRIAHNLLD